MPKSKKTKDEPQIGNIMEKIGNAVRPQTSKWDSEINAEKTYPLENAEAKRIGNKLIKTANNTKSFWNEVLTKFDKIRREEFPNDEDELQDILRKVRENVSNDTDDEYLEDILVEYVAKRNETKSKKSSYKSEYPLENEQSKKIAEKLIKTATSIKEFWIGVITKFEKIRNEPLPTDDEELYDLLSEVRENADNEDENEYIEDVLANYSSARRKETDGKPIEEKNVNLDEIPIVKENADGKMVLEKDEKLKFDANENNSMRICQYCGKPMNKDNIICQYCGKITPIKSKTDNLYTVKPPEYHGGSFSKAKISQKTKAKTKNEISSKKRKSKKSDSIKEWTTWYLDIYDNANIDSAINYAEYICSRGYSDDINDGYQLIKVYAENNAFEIDGIIQDIENQVIWRKPKIGKEIEKIPFSQLMRENNFLSTPMSRHEKNLNKIIEKGSKKPLHFIIEVKCKGEPRFNEP